MAARMSFPVPGGRLSLCWAADVTPQYWFEFEGRIPKEWAVELARRLDGCPAAGGAVKVDGGTLAEVLGVLESQEM